VLLHCCWRLARDFRDNYNRGDWHDGVYTLREHVGHPPETNGDSPE